MSRRRNSAQRAACSGQSGRKPFVWVEINLDNLRHNLRQIRRLTRRSGAGILAIVKADAYGHGMSVIAGTLFREGVRFFGVASLEEAIHLRKSCPEAKILTLGSFHAEQATEYVRHQIRPTLSSPEDLAAFERGISPGKVSAAHVKIDTGMSRLGVWHGDALGLFKKIQGHPRVEIEGVYTHFSSADEKNDDFTKLQWYRFETVLEKLRAMNICPRFVHAANSLALTRFPAAHADLVRPGIMLYGLNPWEGQALPFLLKPVMSLKARISFLKDVPVDRPLSYGRTYQTSKTTRIAILPIGYSHGYRAGFSNKGFVLVKGRRCPVVGRVTMDQTLVDVGHVPGVRRWDVATLLGRDGRETISAEEMARWLGTIPYEIVCGIHSRIPRLVTAPGT